VQSLLITTVMVTLLGSGSVYAESDTPEARAKLVDEYFSHAPMASMMNELAHEVAKQLPDAKREQFVTTLTRHVRMDVIESAARESLARNLTLSELKLFVEFIKKPEARSAMDKMKYYMADLMPVVQQEPARAVKQTAESQK